MRLPVIMVQNPPASGAALADALVGNLIGRAGLDLTLIDRFEALGPETTDRMTLEGITVPAAVLDWRPHSETKTALKEIGFEGLRCPHQLDKEASESPAEDGHVRRLFLFDLNQSTDPMVIIAELSRLRDSLSVKTVSLGGLPTTKSDAPGSIHSSPANPNPAASPAPTAPAQILETKPQPTDRAETTSDAGLDALIDQLDELDV